MNYKQIFWSSLGIKLILALVIPLTLDEYYYFLWGQHLSLSYFDHPPMVGWLMGLSQPLKFISEGAIRWPFIFMTHGSLLIWDFILKDQLSEKRRLLFLVIGLLNPLWGWGAFIATPDIPLVFFWSLALYFVSRILTKDCWSAYLGLALALGCGFLSKYHVALFLPCLLVMLWQQNQWRKLFAIKAWTAIFLALLICSPVFLWNAANDWVSIKFQWNHGMNFKYWKWTLPLEYLLGQIFIIFPPFLLFLFQKNRTWKSHWLLPFVAFPFAFFLYSSFKGRVEGNWVIMSIPCLYAMSVLFSKEYIWNYCQKSIYVWATLFVLAVSLIPFKGQLPVKKVKLFEADQYSVLVPLVQSDKNFYAYSYQLASFLSFQTDQLVCKLPGYGRPDHFQFLKECQDFNQGFSYITEENDRRDFSNDFPGLKKDSQMKIGQQFKVVEVSPQ